MSAAATSDGGCRCGRIRFRLTGDPLVTMACHCRGCQRMTASAFSLSAFYPIGQFEVLAGEPVVGGMHGETRHMFCRYCMSWLYTQPDGLDDFVNVRSTLIDDVDPSPPFIETVTSEALPWARTGAAHSFGGFPPRDRFPTLIAEFISEKQRPRVVG